MAFGVLVLGLASCGSSLPDECTSDPWENEPCIRALQELCSDQTDAEDCAAVGPFTMEDTGNVYACNWAASVILEDPASCSAAEPTSYCVAVSVDAGFRCADGCESDLSENGMRASTTRDEVLMLSCPPDGASVSGPLDETYLLSDATFSHLTCSPNTQPQADAELCACRAAVCDALGR